MKSDKEKVKMKILTCFLFAIVISSAFGMLTIRGRINHAEENQQYFAQLTTDSTDESHPEWSPGGTEIIFMKAEYTSDSTNYPQNVWITNKDGSSQRTLTHSTGWDCNRQPKWSYDGTQITFWAFRPFGEGGSIWVMDADGSSQVKIHVRSDYDASKPAFSPDGTRIVFTSCKRYDGGPSELYIMDPDGNNVVKILNALGDRSDSKGKGGGSVSFSPDGQWIAFESERAGNWDIWIVRPNGSDLTQLTEDPSDDFYPAWSPDGKQITFTSNRSGNDDIWILTNVQEVIDRGIPKCTQLTKDKSDDRYSAWSPEGKKIAFSSYRGGTWDIWVADLGAISYSTKIFNGLLAILISTSAIFLLRIIKRFMKKRKVLENSLIATENTQDVIILSLEKRTEKKYRVSLESVHRTIHPVKSTRTIEISPEMRSEIISRIDWTSRVINTVLSFKRKEERKKPLKSTEELKRMGTVIYKNFIPRDFAQKLTCHYLVLEVEDIQVPWELMYSDQFFALKYAISRRIKSEQALEIQQTKKREKKALIIADPTETSPEAVEECEYLREHLKDFFKITLLKAKKARKVDVMYHFSQRYDIIHYAGDLDMNTGLPVYKDVITCAEIERTLEGSPVVFLNGCCSAKAFSYDIEGLAKVFLERGALSFIGSLWGIHDKTAHKIAAEFYKACLDYPVGEALRLSREKYYSPGDMTWAAFIMYGDPTLRLSEQP